MKLHYIVLHCCDDINHRWHCLLCTSNISRSTTYTVEVYGLRQSRNNFLLNLLLLYHGCACLGGYVAHFTVFRCFVFGFSLCLCRKCLRCGKRTRPYSKNKLV